MKNSFSNSYSKIVQKMIILVISFLFSVTSGFSQTFNANYQPVNFGGTGVTITNKVGTGTSVNNKILYQNVITIGTQSIDAIVTTAALNNVGTFTAFDQTGTGTGFTNNLPVWFSPQFNFGTGGGSAQFRFEFILGGSYNNTTNTGTPVTLQNVRINTYDIDGNGTTGTNQFNEFGGFITYELGNPTNLATSYNGSLELTKFRSNLSANSADPNDVKNRVRVTYSSLNTFTISVGSEGSGLAYFFLDFSTGPTFTTAVLTSAPNLDLNTNTSGLNNSNVFSGNTSVNFSNGATNITSTGTTLDDLKVSFTSAMLLNGASELLVFNGATAGGTIPLNFANNASISNLTVGGLTYAVTATIASGVSTLSFTKSGGGTVTLAQVEAFIDAMRYQNSATTPSSGTRTFNLKIRDVSLTSPTAQFITQLYIHSCPSVDSRNNGNGQASQCAGVGANAMAPGFQFTTYATIPTAAKTGDIIFRWATLPSIIPAITRVWINGTLSAAQVGPASTSTISGSNYLIKYCFYNVNLPPAGVYTLEFTDPSTGAILGRCTYTGNTNVVTTEPTLSNGGPLSANTVSITNASCSSLSNGSATVQGVDGVPPYRYSWAPNGGTGSSAIGLAAGTYYCTVTDTANTSVIDTIVIGFDNVTPSVSGTTPGSVCGTGTVTLGATASAGTLNWYAALTGGTSLSSGTSFITPSISSTTMYYVDATANGCTTVTRSSVLATVNTIPSISATTPATRCSTGTVNLAATASAGTINWYAASTGGSSLATGTSYTTPSIASTNTYYVDASENGCTTAARTAVVATVNPLPSTPTSGVDGSRTGTGTVAISASVSSGETIDWYAALTGGSVLSGGTGTTSFTTPSISITTTYYAQARNTTTGCISTERVSITATVTVLDTVRPVVVTQNRTVYLSAAGTASVLASQVNNGSSDASGIASLSLSQTSFTCANVGTPVTVTLTVTDVNSNSQTGTATVTVLDTVRPVVVTQNRTVYLSSAGTATVSALQINNGSSDACGIATLTVLPNTFNCSNVGTNTVTLTVTDINGNIKTATAIVTIQDTVRPVVVTQNITVQLNSLGAVSITANQVNNGTTDACGISTFTVSPNTFSCSNIGTNTVTLTATDVNGNVKTGTAIVTVQDTVRPIVITRNITVQLNSLGTASITGVQINNGSTDVCGINTSLLSVSPNTFNCSNVGANTVTLTVTDNNGITQTGTAIVTVQDTFKPVVNTQNITTYLGSNGTTTITAAQINNGSSDACGIASLSVSPSIITCSDLGIKTVTLTLTDINGNVNTATSNVVVLDPIAPEARPKATYNAYLSLNGQVIINPGLLDSASTDNCSITSRVLSQSVFNCSNIGINNILFTVLDQSGNSNSATVAVNIIDTIAPNVIVSNQSVYLNASGTGSITAAQVNNNSTDNCGLATLVISKNTFTCSDLGTNNIIFTATDVNSNIKASNVIVNVFDTIRPNMRPKQNINVYVSSTGTASITVADVDSTSADNCSIATRTLSQTVFTCANVGINTLTLSGTDITGNVGTRTFTVTVLDTVRPILTTKPASIYVNASGSAGLTAAQVILSSSDNCSSGLLSSINQNNFSCTNLGLNTVAVTVTDASGNFITNNASVTVIDTIKPNVLTQNRTIYLNALGTASLTAAQVNNGTTDNCTIQSLSISKTSYTATDLGINNITFTATDNSSNSQTVNVIITVLDTVRPIVITQNRTIYLNASGTASVTAAQVNNGSSDNAGVTTALLNRTAFSCADLGTNLVTLTVSDNSNNSTSGTSIITVFDTIKPAAIARNLTLYLNAIGQVSITPAQANNGTIDNCSIANLSISKSSSAI